MEHTHFCSRCLTIHSPFPARASTQGCHIILAAWAKNSAARGTRRWRSLLLPNCRPMYLPTLQQSECVGYPGHLKVEQNNELPKHELSIWWFLYMFLASSSLSEPPTAKLMFEKHIRRWGEREREGGIKSSHIINILPMKSHESIAVFSLMNHIVHCSH